MNRTANSLNKNIGEEPVEKNITISKGVMRPVETLSRVVGGWRVETLRASPWSIGKLVVCVEEEFSQRGEKKNGINLEFLQQGNIKRVHPRKYNSIEVRRN